MKGKPLPTENDVGMVRKNLVDKWRRFAVANEYGDCSYSLLHQVLGFWIRHGFNGAKILIFTDVANFFLPIHKIFVFLHLEILKKKMKKVMLLMAAVLMLGTAEAKTVNVKAAEENKK